MLASAALAAALGSFAFRLLCEVGELVGTEDKLLAFASITMTFGIGSIDIILHGASLHGSEESALFFHLQEELPCSICQRGGELLNEIRTSRGVNDLVEMTLFLEQELLIACNALRELCRLLINVIERSNHDRVNTCKGCTHGLCL